MWPDEIAKRSDRFYPKISGMDVTIRINVKNRDHALSASLLISNSFLLNNFCAQSIFALRSW